MNEPVKAEDLVFAATSRCPCGAGLAYKKGENTNPDSPFKLADHWDCSAILIGRDVKHTAKLPFVFWKVKSENQPSAGGATTRPGGS
jgi:hypothetical protein